MSIKLLSVLSAIAVLGTVTTSNGDDTGKKAAMAPMLKMTGCVHFVSYTADGARLLVPGNRPDGRGGGTGGFIYDASSFQELASLSTWPLGVVCMATDRKNRFIITAGAEVLGPRKGPSDERGDLKIWDAKTNKLLHDLRGPKRTINEATVSPDGKTLVAVSSTDGSDGDGRTVWIWEIEKGILMKAFHGHYLYDAERDQPSRGGPCVVNTAAFAPDGKTLATGAVDKRIRIWDAANRFRELGSLEGHTDFVQRIAYFPTGDKLASVGWDGTAIIWDLTTRKPVHFINLKNKRLWAVDVAVSPDGKVIATADNVEVDLWDAATGKLIDKPGLTQSGPSCVAFSPDGKYLAIGFNDYFPNRKPSSSSLGVVQWSLAERKYREPVK